MKQNEIMSKIRQKLFQFKVWYYGPYFWVGPETEIGICEDCAMFPPKGRNVMTKVPVRRLDEFDNIYLCRDHWERIRNHPDPECRMDILPFIRKGF